MDLSKGAGLGLSHVLVVTRVVAASPAFLQGLKVGCRVLAVAGERVETLKEFKDAFTRCRDRGDLECTIDYRKPTDAEAAELSEQIAASAVEHMDPAMLQAMKAREIFEAAKRSSSADRAEEAAKAKTAGGEASAQSSPPPRGGSSSRPRALTMPSKPSAKPKKKSLKSSVWGVMGGSSKKK